MPAVNPVGAPAGNSTCSAITAPVLVVGNSRYLCAWGGNCGDGDLAFRRRIKKNIRNIARITPAAATPTPMPALAPLESPEGVGEAAGEAVDEVVDEFAVEAMDGVPVVVDTVVVVADGVVKSVDCHRMEIPYALMWPLPDMVLVVLDVDPSVPSQVYV